MTLQVPFEEFPATVKRLLDVTEAYVSPHEAGALVTACNPQRGCVVASVTPYDAGLASSKLQEAGFEVFGGTWRTGEEIAADVPGVEQVYVAAVSYRSTEERAGVWVDAYAALPTQVTVLRGMYEEFRATGELDEVPFEEFVQLANPNVVIVSPSEIQSFLRQKEEC